MDKLNRSVKSHWSSEVKAAYRDLTARTSPPQLAESAPQTVDPEVKLFVTEVKADDAARRARNDAQDTFDEAERLLSTKLAREGCRKAIHPWELDEKAIRRAKAFPGPAKAAGVGTLVQKMLPGEVLRS